MAILLNIGNTHTEIVLAGNDGICGKVRRCLTSCLADELEEGIFAKNPEEVCVAACVVPAAADLLSSRRSAGVRFLTAREIDWIDFSGVDVARLGADRVANTIAGVRLCGAPVLIVDCGTAITIEVIDARMRFYNGAIAPGRRLQRRALASFTALLPEVAMSNNVPPALSADTEGAIFAGVDLGTLGMVEKLVKASLAQLGDDSVPVVVAGGDASFLAGNLGFCAAPAEFTLSGVLEFARRKLNDLRL